jgi:hypothetical protein
MGYYTVFGGFSGPTPSHKGRGRMWRDPAWGRRHRLNLSPR